MGAIAGVVLGFLSWTALWLAGSLGLAVLFPAKTQAWADGGHLEDPLYLALSVLLSVICSLLAGFVAALFGGERVRGTVLVTGGLLLVTGAAIQAGVWTRMPLWYHLVFLALLVPGCLLGERFARPRRTAPTEPGA